MNVNDKMIYVRQPGWWPEVTSVVRVTRTTFTLANNVRFHQRITKSQWFWPVGRHEGKCCEFSEEALKSLKAEYHARQDALDEQKADLDRQEAEKNAKHIVELDEVKKYCRGKLNILYQEVLPTTGRLYVLSVPHCTQYLRVIVQIFKDTWNMSVISHRGITTVLDVKAKPTYEETLWEAACHAHHHG